MSGINLKVTILTLAVLLLPLVALGQEGEFKALVGIPNLDPEQPDIETYLNVLYVLSISIAALLAVVKIIFAGVKYMVSDVVPTKESAKKDIKGAIFGLLIVIGAVLILETINPKLSSTSVLRDLPEQRFSAAGTFVASKLDTNSPLDLSSVPKDQQPEAIRAYAKKCLASGDKRGVLRAGDIMSCAKSEENTSTNNTDERRTRLLEKNEKINEIGKFNYNVFVASYEPANVTSEQINSVVEANNGSDFFFVVHTIPADIGDLNAKAARNQQKDYCEVRAEGKLVDAEAGFSVCVIN